NIHIIDRKYKKYSAHLIMWLNSYEMATSALEGKAYTLLTDGFSESLLQETLLVRYGVENILKEVATKSANLWGGLNFLSSNEAAYLLVVCQLLSFHPPTKHSALDMMMVLQN
ncbi:hypothetical protein CN643_17415, partial [Parageobacillus yumthangensis]